MNLQARITELMQVIKLKNEAETLALGARLIAHTERGDVIALRGDLGAGKTTLVRGMIQSVLGSIEVPSPTYTLVQVYELPKFELWHCDLYRLETPDDAYELGLIDAMDDVVSVIEWPDRLGGLLPKTAKEIALEFDGEGRTAKLTGWEAMDV